MVFVKVYDREKKRKRKLINKKVVEKFEDLDAGVKENIYVKC